VGYKLVILVVIVVLIVLIMILVAVNNWAGIWDILISKRTTALRILLEGVIAGVVASLIFYLITRLFDKPQWKALNTRYETLLERLADAVGGSFPRSLFSYLPVASGKIAAILGDEVRERHSRFYNRVIIRDATDWYSLKGIKNLNNFMLWDLGFCIEWKWYNDSQVTQRPLENFIIVVSAPLDAFETFLVGTEQRQKEDAEEFMNFVDRSNLVRAYILNPDEQEKRIESNDPLLGHMFKLNKLIVTDRNAKEKYILTPPTEGKAETPGDEEDNLTTIPMPLDFVPQKELPKSMYYGYRMPREVREIELRKNYEIHMRYYGELLLPTFKDPKNTRAFFGHLDFPPSDIISAKYRLVLEYPELLVKSDHGIDGKVEILKSDTWCYLQYESLVNIRGSLFTLSSAPGKPSPFDKERNKSYIQERLIVNDDLTDLYRIKMTWKVEPP